MRRLGESSSSRRGLGGILSTLPRERMTFRYAQVRGWDAALLNSDEEEQRRVVRLGGMSAEWREPVTFDEVAEALGTAPDQVVAMIRPSGQVAAFYEQNAKTWLVKLVRNARDHGFLPRVDHENSPGR